MATTCRHMHKSTCMQTRGSHITRINPYTWTDTEHTHRFWRSLLFLHLTDADGAFIYAPMHTNCQTCRFWLQTGRWAVLQCRCKTFVSRGYLQCSQVGWGEQSACLFQGEIGDWCCLVGMLLVMWSLEMLPCSSALLFSSSFCQIVPPLHTLKPLFFFSNSSEIIVLFLFTVFDLFLALCTLLFCIAQFFSFILFSNSCFALSRLWCLSVRVCSFVHA